MRPASFQGVGLWRMFGSGLGIILAAGPGVKAPRKILPTLRRTDRMAVLVLYGQCIGSSFLQSTGWDGVGEEPYKSLFNLHYTLIFIFCQVCLKNPYFRPKNRIYFRCYTIMIKIATKRYYKDRFFNKKIPARFHAGTIQLFTYSFGSAKPKIHGFRERRRIFFFASALFTCWL